MFYKEFNNSITLFCDDASILISYDIIIAIKRNIKDKKQVYLDKRYWDYSSTTGKHRNAFLDEDKRETMKKIKSGEYILKDLDNIVKLTLHFIDDEKE